MTNYTRGRAFEWRVRDHCQALGYIVTRTPQSRSAFDLIVLGCDVLLLVQCKTDGKISRAEWNALYAVAEKVYATPLLASRVKRKLVFHELLKPRERLRERSSKVQIYLRENKHAQRMRTAGCRPYPPAR